MKTEQQLRTELFERLRDLFPMTNEEKQLIENFEFYTERKEVGELNYHFDIYDLESLIKDLRQSGFHRFRLEDDFSITADTHEFTKNALDRAAEELRGSIERKREFANKNYRSQKIAILNRENASDYIEKFYSGKITFQELRDTLNVT